MKPERGLELDGDLRILARWYDLRAREVAVSPDGRFALLASGGTRSTASLLPLRGGPVRLPPFELDAQSVSFAPDGLAALGRSSFGSPSAIVFWDVEKDIAVASHPSSRLLAHLDARSFVSVHYTQALPSIERWVRGAASPEKSRELRMGRERQHDPDKTGPDATWVVDKAESPVLATPEGRVITCKSEEDGGAALFEWDLDTGLARRLRTFATDFGPGDTLHALPGNRYLARKWWGEWWMALWDFTSETELWRMPFGFSDSAFAVDAAGTRAVVAQAGGRIEVRDTHDGKILVGARILPHRHLGVEAFAFTPDGRLLMCMSDGIVALLEIP